MRTLAHLSDLHFGKAEHAVVEALVKDLEHVGPSLVVVSGDLTQRGRRREFEAARAFLERLPAPVLTVPGNHDIAAVYNPLHRLWRPFAAYSEHISPNLTPIYQDEELIVVGLNSVRAERWKEGALSAAQLGRLVDLLSPMRKFKVVAMHHPVTIPEGARGRALVGAGAVVEAFRNAGVDLLLTGHLHHGHLADLPVCYVDPTHTILASHATTATSTRLRKDLNGYHSIRISRTEICIDRRHFQLGAFRSLHAVICRKARKNWRIEESRDDLEECAQAS